MKFLFAIVATLIGYSSTAQTKPHPMIDQLAAEADVIVVAKHREPQIWRGSELIVMTGLSTALVERTLKGKELPSKITVKVVRHLDIQNLALEPPQVPIEAKNFPVTPVAPTKYVSPDVTTDQDNADKVIVFLRRSKDGELHAIDGFLYTLPFSDELESALLASIKNQVQQDDSRKPR
jgi:hypothetical protein